MFFLCPFPLSYIYVTFFFLRPPSVSRPWTHHTECVIDVKSKIKKNPKRYDGPRVLFMRHLCRTQSSPLKNVATSPST